VVTLSLHNLFSRDVEAEGGVKEVATATVDEISDDATSEAGSDAESEEVSMDARVTPCCCSLTIKIFLNSTKPRNA
jgi:hypothetical protein